MTTRVFGMVLAATLLLVTSGPVAAQQAKCLAGKTKCVAKKGTGLLKCHTNAETPGKPADPNAGGCVDKVVAKFDGGVDPTKGCFEKLENKSHERLHHVRRHGLGAKSAVDSCVAAFVDAIDPAPITQTKCGAGKKKCVSKYCKARPEVPPARADARQADRPEHERLRRQGRRRSTRAASIRRRAASTSSRTRRGTTAGRRRATRPHLQALVEDCVDQLQALLTDSTTTTSTTLATTTTTSTIPSGGVELQGALTATPGRFNYNLTLGLPGANAACSSNFPGTHACSYAELQIAEAAGDLVGLQDTASMTVTSFWAIDNSQPPLQQCQDDVSSFLNWEYATAHTASRGQKVALNNGTGALGALQSSLQCNFSTAWVGCCL